MALRMHFGVTPREIFFEWSYRQYKAYMKAAWEIMVPKKRDDEKPEGRKSGKAKDGRNASVAELRALGIPIQEKGGKPVG